MDLKISFAKNKGAAFTSPKVYVEIVVLSLDTIVETSLKFIKQYHTTIRNIKHPIVAIYLFLFLNLFCGINNEIKHNNT